MTPMHRSGRKFKLTKEDLRAFLRKPIRAYRLKATTAEEQDRLIAEQTADRIEAMCILFDIPGDWPDDVQWEWLARCLAGEAFAGCRTLSRGLGGPRKSTLAMARKKKESLSLRFEAYRRAHRLSESAAAANFLNKNLADCNEVGLYTPKSFAQAMRALRKETGISTEAGGS
ncbi:MAG: hypothetical protein ABSA66_10410 [Roseiarcus sp.]|jgi:hypothetical protein